MSRSKFLFVSRYGLCGALAWRVAREGHPVRLHIQSRGEREVMDGFVEKAGDLAEAEEWAQVVVYDDNGFAEAADRLRRRGKAVVGPTAYSDRLELDRDFGQAEMEAAGLTVLPRWDFDSFEAALEFLRKTPGRYVVKPNGKVQDEKVLSYVGREEDGRDVATVLEHYRRGWGTKIKSFQLQRYASGVEVAVGAYFNGKEFVLPACVNFEHKRMFNDEIGPSTGEMGTSMFWAEPNRLFRETLGRLQERLSASGYAGYVDVNCIASARAIHPLEVTTRFGYPTVNIQMEGVSSPWGELLESLARGQPFRLKTRRGFQIGVVLAVPPFPFDDPGAFRKYSEDAVILFERPPKEGEAPEGVHPCEVKQADGDWRLTGTSGYALVVTGSGTTMEEAREEAYRRVRNIHIPNVFYRTDIGRRWTRDGDCLQTWGVLA